MNVIHESLRCTSRKDVQIPYYRKFKKESYAAKEKREPPIEINLQSQCYIILLNGYIGFVDVEKGREVKVKVKKKKAKTIKDT